MWEELFLEALEIYTNNGTLDSFYKIAKRRNELVVDIKSPEQREQVDLRNFFTTGTPTTAPLKPCEQAKITLL